MIEHEIAKIQLVSTLKLVVAAGLFFYLLPTRIFPQDDAADTYDKVMSNIIHMSAVATLVFPLFIYLKLFGFPFLVIFFAALKLAFVKFGDRKPVVPYLQGKFLLFVEETLKILEKPRAYRKVLRLRAVRSMKAVRGQLCFDCVLPFLTNVLIVLYICYLLLYRNFVSLVGAVPDTYQFYYWNNILKINVLFDKIAGAPYMWGGPVLVHTFYLLTRLDTVVLYDIFPLLSTLFILFSIFYCTKKLLEATGEKTASMSVALILFGIVLASPVSQQLFGYVFITSKPEMAQLSFLSFYSGAHPGENQVLSSYPFNFYWRLTATLPHEIAAGFFLVNLYFLIAYLQSKSTRHLFLYAETLAIILAIHSGVAIALLFPTLMIAAYSAAVAHRDFKALRRWVAFAIPAALLGNLWMIQFYLYGLPDVIGSAAPFLDRLLKTKVALQGAWSTDLYSVQLVSCTGWLLMLLAGSLAFFLAGKFSSRLGFTVSSFSLISLAVLFLYFAQNLGFPKILDHNRLQIFVAYSYAIVCCLLYHLVVERSLLQPLFKALAFRGSSLVVLAVALFAMVATPRWIDTEEFWQTAYGIEYKETPYVVHAIQSDLQPFTYTVVSYVQQFPQVLSKGYHVNTQELLQEYDPRDNALGIPTDYVFIVVESAPKDFNGTGEYWYRWRRDIMLKLKEWLTLYSAGHQNITLWYQSPSIQVYCIDNRSSLNARFIQRKTLLETLR